MQTEKEESHFLRAPIFKHGAEKLASLREKGMLERGDLLDQRIEGVLNAARKGADFFRQELNDARERVKMQREFMKARLAAYEEGGSSEFHFSLACAKKTLQGAEACAPPHGKSDCTWCTVQDIFGFCTSTEDEELLSEFGIECGVSSDSDMNKDEIENNYSLQCLEAASSDNCGNTNDEDGNTCVWCQYNSWIGMCVSPDDKETAENDLFMSCGASSIA